MLLYEHFLINNKNKAERWRRSVTLYPFLQDPYEFKQIIWANKSEHAIDRKNASRHARGRRWLLRSNSPPRNTHGHQEGGACSSQLVLAETQMVLDSLVPC